MLVREQARDPIPSQTATFSPEERDVGLVRGTRDALQRTERLDFVEIKRIREVRDFIG